MQISGESLSIREGVKMPTQGLCARCGYISSMELCKACVMLEGLNKGMPRLGVGKSSKVKGALNALDTNRNLGRRSRKTRSSDNCKNPKDQWRDFNAGRESGGGCGGGGGGGHGCSSCSNPKADTGPDEMLEEDEHSCQPPMLDESIDIDIENLGILAKTMLTLNG